MVSVHTIDSKLIRTRKVVCVNPIDFALCGYTPQLKSILVVFCWIYSTLNPKQPALVTTAIPLNTEMKSEVLNVISKLTNKQTILSNKVDNSLIGGFILRVGDIEYNASFKNKLKTIKQEFTNNTNLSI